MASTTEHLGQTGQPEKTLQLAGRTLPRLGMGTWHMGDDPSATNAELAALRAGLDAGLTAIDTAEMYGNGNSETLVGKVLPQYERSDLFVISKFTPTHAAPDALVRSLDASLRRLGTDYLDLYLYHWPGRLPLAPTVEALEAAKARGKIRAWGVSNFDVDDMNALVNVPGGDAVAANEILYNVGERGVEFDLLPWLDAHGIPTIAYTPIAQGDSLGRNLTATPVLRDIARAHGIGVFQVMLAWTIRKSDVLAIPQSSNAEHVAANLEALTVDISAAEFAAIDEVFPAPHKPQPLAML